MTEKNRIGSEPAPRRRLRFSLGSLLLLVTAISLAIALALTHQKLTIADRQLKAVQPLSPEEVASQFESQTTLGSIKTTVRDVRYSPGENAYKVAFSWVESKTAQEWSTEVILTADGFGAYHGKIQSDQFVKPSGIGLDFFPVELKTPSPLRAN